MNRSRYLAKSRLRRPRALFAALAISLAGSVHAGAPSVASLSGAPTSTQLQWAARFEHGEGIPRDVGRAVQLYCLAASRGSSEAQYQLGWMYANGRGVPRDDALAAAWFRKAAAKGDAISQRLLIAFGKVKMKSASCVGPTRGAGAGVVQVAYRAAPRVDFESTPERRQIVAWVREMAPEYQLDPDLVLAVLAMESGFSSSAVSPKNAQGLMQLIPETADRFGVQDAFDPVQNLRGGMAYLRWLLAFFGGDVPLALAGYNAGEKAVERYGGVPPYPETQAYVSRIVQRYGKIWHPPVAGVVEPSTLISAAAARVQAENKP